MVEHIQWSFFAKIPNGVELLTLLQEKPHPRCLTRLKIGFWSRVLHMKFTFVPNLQMKLKKYSARKNVRHRFWKGERSWQENKQSKWLCRSSRPKGSLKKLLWEISQNSQEKICTRIPFWCFLVNFAKFTRSPFLYISTGRLLLIIAVSIVAKRVLVNETVNYKTRTKAHVLILASVQVIKKGSPGEREGFRSRRLLTSN